MLRHYRRAGPNDPVAAHVEAGGDGDRAHAYARTRPLRTAGLVSHAGRSRYEYALPDLVREACGDRLSDAELDRTVAAIEAAFVPPGDDGPADGGRQRAGHEGETRDGERRGERDGDPGNESGAETGAGIGTGAGVEAASAAGTAKSAAGSNPDRNGASGGLSEAALRLSGTTGTDRGFGAGGAGDG
jgi:hypothetical protein